MLHLENIEEYDKVINNDKVVIDFYAEWCGPCKMLSPIIEAVAEEKSDITFIKINTDNFPDLARKYGVMVIPTIVVLEKGTEVRKATGLMSKTELEDLIK